MSVRTSQLRLDVAELLRAPGTTRVVRLDARWDDLGITATEVPADRDVAVSLVTEATPGRAVTVRGTVTFEWAGACSRCLARVAGRSVAEVHEVFEHDHVEGETWPLEGDQIDVTDLVRETVVLELPQAPRCDGDCQGLCPQCGADLNAGDCGCEPEPDPRWAALDALKFDTSS